MTINSIMNKITFVLVLMIILYLIWCDHDDFTDNNDDYKT